MLRRFRDLVSELGSCEDVELTGSLRLGPRKVKVPGPPMPLQIVLGGEGGKALRLQPELTLNAKGEAEEAGACLLFDPDEFFAGISGFLRLRPGDSVILGREDRLQRGLLKYPKSVADSHLSLKLTADGLVLKDRAPGHGTCLSLLVDDPAPGRIVALRRGRLERLMGVLPVPLSPLPREEALELILSVIELMKNEPRQAPGTDGECGGVVAFPDDLDIVFIGDLHARVDNLLVLLTQNGFLEALEAGTAVLVILGDAVHPDEEGEEDRMDTSMLMMDIIFRLKVAFPSGVYYIRGNHDSYSEDISKGGVPQGLQWEQALHQARGAAYVRAMSRFYDALPYVALSRRIIACHAGAPTSKVSRDVLINVRQHPKVMHDLTHVRLRRPNSPQGYNRGDVKRLRQRLDLASDTPFIAGHTPLSADDTLWLNAGGIPDHHILFGAHRLWVGVIAQVGKRLIPLRYPVEPLHRAYNWLAARG